jgi:hypothetical protein
MCAAFIREKIELKRLVKGSVGSTSVPSSFRDRLRMRIRL